MKISFHMIIINFKMRELKTNNKFQKKKINKTH